MQGLKSHRTRINGLVEVSPCHFKASTKIEDLARWETVLDQIQEVLCRVKPVLWVTTRTDVGVDLLHLKIFCKLIKVLMPNAKAVLGSSHHCLGVISRTKARIYTDTCHLFAKLRITSKSIKLLFR